MSRLPDILTPVLTSSDRWRLVLGNTIPHRRFIDSNLKIALPFEIAGLKIITFEIAEFTDRESSDFVRCLNISLYGVGKREREREMTLKPNYLLTLNFNLSSNLIVHTVFVSHAWAFSSAADNY
jgi:hypothetical protein